MNARHGQTDPSGSDERFDRRLQTALQSVVVPEDLRSKLQLRIHQQAAVKASADALPESLDGRAAGRDSGRRLQLPAAISEALAKSQLARSKTAWIKTSWPRRTVYVAAACLAVAVVGLGWLQPKRDPQQLAGYCSDQLVVLSENGAWQRDASLPVPLQQFIQQQLSLSQPHLLGEKSCDPGDFGEECSVWKFMDRRGEMYIFVFEQSPSMNQLSSQLRVIQDSGTWTLAARQSAEHLIVVAALGDVRQYFNTNLA